MKRLLITLVLIAIAALTVAAQSRTADRLMPAPVSALDVGNPPIGSVRYAINAKRQNGLCEAAPVGFTPIGTDALKTPDGWMCTSRAAGVGAGDVLGASASTNSELPLFSGTGGKTLQRSNNLSGIVKLTAGVVSMVGTIPPGNIISGTLTDTKCLRYFGGAIVLAADDCGTGSGGGLADPGSNGLIKRTALNVTTPAIAGTDYLLPAGSGAALTSITFSQLGGIASDSQIPNSITIDLATLATTATTANAGDSATAFFTAGTLEAARGGTGLGVPAEDQTLVGNGTGFDFKTLPACSNATDDKLLYNSTTNTFTCGSDQSAGAGSGVTTLNTLIGVTQTFSKTDGTNVTLTITSTGTDHNFALGWTGTLAASLIDDGAVAATQALFSGAGGAAGFRAIADADVPNTITVDLAAVASAGDSATAFFSAGTIEAAYLPNAVADGATKGIASFTAADFNATAGNISIDYTNGQAASGSVKGFLTAADWMTFNDKVSAGSLASSALTMTTARMLGRTTAATGAIEELTAAAAKTFLAVAFSDLLGSITDAQVPNTITVDLATVATTASAGDSATAFFSTGALEKAVQHANTVYTDSAATITAVHSFNDGKLKLPGGAYGANNETVPAVVADTFLLNTDNNEVMVGRHDGSSWDSLLRSGVTTVNLASANVSGDLPLSNLAQASAASVVLGRGSASGAGDFQEITLGANLTMTGTVLSATGGAGSGTITAGVTNFLPKYIGSTTIDDSLLSDDGTSLVYTGTGGITAASFTASGLGTTVLEFLEGAAPSALVSNSFIEYAPVDVPVGGLAYVFPNTAATGIIHVTNVSGTMTQSISGIAIADLTATGTPSSSTFYRGDNSWAVPAGGGDMLLGTAQTNTVLKTFNDLSFKIAGGDYGATDGSLPAVVIGTVIRNTNASSNKWFVGVDDTVDFWAEIQINVVSGPTSVANGGTSLATLTANNVILGNGTSAPTFVAPSTSGNVLTSNGTTWVSSASGGVSDGDKGDITVTASGATWTIDTGLSAAKIGGGGVSTAEFDFIGTLSSNAQTQIDGKQPLDSDLTALAASSSNGIYVRTGTGSAGIRTIVGTTNEITVSNGDGVSANPTLSFPSTIDLSGKTSLALPNAAAPTVDAFAEIAGDNNLWAASRGAPVFFDGTAAVALIGTLVSDTPTNGQVPKWNTGGTITWEDDGGGGGVPTTITVADTTDTTSFLAFFESATGDLAPKTDGGATYNASTGVLTATGFVGPLTGDVTGNVTGSSGSTTGNAATVTTNANLTGHVTSTGNAAVLGSFTVAQLNTAISDADVQQLDSDLTTIAGLAATTDNFIVSVASAWASRTPAQVKTTLAIAFTDISGSVTDAQVPNTITVDLATLATTATTANAGDSATAFFSAGTLETARLGSGTADSTTFLRGDNTWATPSGSGTITAGATNAIPKYTASTTIDDSLLSDDATTLTYTGAGGLTLAPGGTGAGYLQVTEGSTAPTLVANTFQIYAGADVAAGGLAYRLPVAGATGFMLATNTSGDMVITHVASSGSGSVCLTTNCSMTTPALGTPSALVATNATGTAAGLTAGNVTTNANLTGHVTSTGNAAVLGSFTLAQLNTAVSDADFNTVSSETVAGIIEIATTAEINTGTDATRAVAPDQFVASIYGEQVVSIVVLDTATAATTGDGKFYFVVPSKLDGMNLVAVSAQVNTAGTTSTLNVDLARCAVVATGNMCSGTVVDLLSTNLTLDTTENKSSTAAAAAVIDTANDDVATDQVIRIDIDAIQTTPSQGLIISLSFRKP